MRLQGELVEARLVRRANRFAAEILVGGERAVAHVPNSGRLGELLYPGAEVLVAARPGPRKTPYDLLLARYGDELVSIDARLPNALLAEALRAGRLSELGPFASLRREVPLGESRLDLLLEGPAGLCYVEAKSVTLVQAGTARFPDAPTLRGARHLLELERAAHMGHRAAVVFVVQRGDARRFRPYEEADPAFAATLRRVAPVVQVLAYRCRVTPGEVEIVGPMDVVL